MKKNCSLLVAFFLIAGYATALQGQSSFTYANFQAYTALGKSMNTQEDTITKSVNIGAPGATSWDFGALKSHNMYVMTYVTPSTAPQYGLFPNANLVQKFTQVSQGIGYDFYLFSQLSSSAYISWGLSMSGTLMPGLIQTMLNTKSNGENAFPVPLTYNASWSSNFSDTTKAMMNGLPAGNTQYGSNSITYLVDAYGTVTYPGGGSSQALRIKRDSRKSTKFSPNGIATYSRDINYTIFAMDGTSFSITAKDTTSPSSGVIALGRNISWTTQGTTDVKNEGTNLTEFELLQNYPNPFNPSTTITYNIKEKGDVTLKVFDAMGKEVSILVNGYKNAGTYTVQFNGSQLASGTYYCELKQNNNKNTKKLILLK